MVVRGQLREKGHKQRLHLSQMSNATNIYLTIYEIPAVHFNVTHLNPAWVHMNYFQKQ